MVYCTSCVLQCDDTFVLNAFCYAGEEEKNTTKLCRKYELHTFAIVMMWSLACVPHLMLITSSASCFERRALSLSLPPYLVFCMHTVVMHAIVYSSPISIAQQPCGAHHQTAQRHRPPASSRTTARLWCTLCYARNGNAVNLSNIKYTSADKCVELPSAMVRISIL